MHTCPADLFGLTGAAAVLAQLVPWLLLMLSVLRRVRPFGLRSRKR